MKNATMTAKNYLLNLPGLGEAVASCQVDANGKHQSLVKCLQRFEGLAETKLATTRGDSYLVKRKVLAGDGTLIHDDHEAWLRQELEADGGRPAVTRSRLAKLDCLLTRCELTTIYLVHDNLKANQADFIQVEVFAEDEFVDCKLFGQHSWRSDAQMRDARDLLNDAVGDSLPDDQRRRFRPTEYRLLSTKNIAAFVVEIEALDELRREQLRNKRFRVTTVSTGVERVMSQDDFSPGWDKMPHRARRLFDDWANSSAGRSGARFCDHWVAQTSDYTSPDGQRSVDLVPLWTFGKNLAKVESGKGSVYELYGKLEKLDHRVKVPFAWFFYFLHGNRVSDSAAKRILKAAEDGLVVIPEHDYQVLRTWAQHEYFF